MSPKSSIQSNRYGMETLPSLFIIRFTPPRFNRTDTEWKPREPLVPIVVFDSIEPIRNGNISSRWMWGCSVLDSIEPIRNGNVTTYSVYLEETDSIEPIRNGNYYPKSHYSHPLIQSNRYGMETHRCYKCAIAHPWFNRTDTEWKPLNSHGDDKALRFNRTDTEWKPGAVFPCLPFSAIQSNRYGMETGQP